MVLRLTYKTTVFICLFASISIGLKGHGTIDKDKKYIELVDLYESFRQFIYPEVKNGVPDYRVKEIKKKLDHKCINDIKEIGLPSLENISFWIGKQLKKKYSNVRSIKISRPSCGESCIYNIP